MYKKEYDIFISYRRENGEDKARILNQFLSAAGYRVFFDHEAGMTGEFETEILAAVEIAPVFLMLMTPQCFDRCVNEGDWVSREIERAIKLDKHIIPIRPNYDFDFTTMPAGIPEHAYPSCKFSLPYAIPYPSVGAFSYRRKHPRKKPHKISSEGDILF